MVNGIIIEIDHPIKSIYNIKTNDKNYKELYMQLSLHLRKCCKQIIIFQVIDTISNKLYLH